MNSIKINLVAFGLSTLFIGCGVSKGYLGSRLPDSELAIIIGKSHSTNISGKNYQEKVLITRVDSLVVGNYSKGWPKNLKVRPGKHQIEVRHFQPWTYPPTIYVPGAIAGGIAGAIQSYRNEKNLTHNHYILELNVEKNTHYSIFIKTIDQQSPPLIEVFNDDKGERIVAPYRLKVIKNKKEALNQLED